MMDPTQVPNANTCTNRRMFVINDFRQEEFWLTARRTRGPERFYRNDPSKATTGTCAPLSSTRRCRKMPKTKIGAGGEDQQSCEREKLHSARLIMRDRYKIPSHLSFTCTCGSYRLRNKVKRNRHNHEKRKQSRQRQSTESDAHAS